MRALSGILPGLCQICTFRPQIIMRKEHGMLFFSDLAFCGTARVVRMHGGVAPTPPQTAGCMSQYWLKVTPPICLSAGTPCSFQSRQQRLGSSIITCRVQRWHTQPLYIYRALAEQNEVNELGKGKVINIWYRGVDPKQYVFWISVGGSKLDWKVPNGGIQVITCLHRLG